jgi:flagellar motor switch protein FliG
MPPAMPALTGARKVAVFTLLVGEESTSQIFRHLKEDEIEQIAREIATMGAVPAGSSEQVLEEFHNMWKAAEYVAHGGVDYAQKLLVKSVGDAMAQRLLDRLVKSFESTVVFTALEKADPQQLSKFIMSEHPQTIALILAHLKPSQASQLVGLLPPQLRADAGRRRSRVVRRRARRRGAAQPPGSQREPARAAGHRR